MFTSSIVPVGVGFSSGYQETKDKEAARQDERDKETLNTYMQLVTLGYKPIDPKRGTAKGAVVQVGQYGFLERPPIDKKAMYDLELKKMQMSIEFERMKRTGEITVQEYNKSIMKLKVADTEAKLGKSLVELEKIRTGNGEKLGDKAYIDELNKLKAGAEFRKGKGNWEAESETVYPDRWAYFKSVDDQIYELGKSAHARLKSILSANIALRDLAIFSKSKSIAVEVDKARTAIEQFGHLSQMTELSQLDFLVSKNIRDKVSMKPGGMGKGEELVYTLRNTPTVVIAWNYLQKLLGSSISTQEQRSDKYVDLLYNYRIATGKSEVGLLLNMRKLLTAASTFNESRLKVFNTISPPKKQK